MNRTLRMRTEPRSFADFIFCDAIPLALCLGITFLMPRHSQAAEEATTQPIHVLMFDSDDLQEQAEVLTYAVRAQVQKLPNWTLFGTPSSLGVLLATLHCPARPDEACLKRIGDQIRSDRFMWGFVSHVRANSAKAEVHLWTRGAPDVVVEEKFLGDIKDPRERPMEIVATRIVSKLLKVPTTGKLNVHAGALDGELVIDGQRREPVHQGQATIELSSGPHHIELRGRGFSPSEMNVDVGVATESDVSFAPTPKSSESTERSSLPIRSIISWSAIGLGAGFIAGGIYEGVKFVSLRDELDVARSKVDHTISDVCSPSAPNAAATNACSKLQQTQNARTLEAVFLGVGAIAAGTGIALLLTAPSSSTPQHKVSKQSPSSSLRVLPITSPTSAGLDLHLTF